MNEKLYNLMDWAKIEGLVYSEDDQPHDLLGAHVCSEGILIQAFFPTAAEVDIFAEGHKDPFRMELEDESGFFAALLPGKKVPDYRFRVRFDDDSVLETADPYNLAPQISEEILMKFRAGICYDIYRYLGAHPMTIDGISGVYFAVWAPNAVRVSVVGDFNLWDGRRLPMRRLGDYGVFELFVPGLKTDTLYKYEIKAKGGLTFLKADPYANAAQLRPDTASVVTDLSRFSWTDDKWMAERGKYGAADSEMAVFEVHLGSFARPDDNRDFYNYRELAPMIASHIKETGYTHVELMPVMEHPLDESCGYQVTGYYAPTARYGTPDDFRYFINYMHEQKIGVILDWPISQFPRDAFALCGFDGTCLYEHQDPRQGTNPQRGTLLYNYGREQVSNFLIANALFWGKEYHADGLRLDSLSGMLYLDYGKRAGEWIANMYGSNENLDAVEFIKHLNSIFHKEVPGALTIAQEMTGWPRVTGALDEDGLGFDYKWNNGWMEDFLSYMQLDPLFRGYHHGELIFSMIYHYSERFLLALPHDEAGRDKGSLLSRMPGKRESKLANLRAAFGYFIAHPGKKLLFMGQDIALKEAWAPENALKKEQYEKESARQISLYMTDLLHLYHAHPALYEMDYDTDGFEWINSISGNENMLVFLRKAKDEKEILLVILNFSPLIYQNHKIGVPFPGKYKEIFSSDAEKYGGTDVKNPRIKQSRKEECDGREDSIRITVPPMGISVFSCTKAEPVLSQNEILKEKKQKEANKAASAGSKSVKSSVRKKQNTKQSLKDKLAGEALQEENRI